MQWMKRLRPLTVVALAGLMLVLMAGVASASEITVTKISDNSPQEVNAFYPGQTIYYTMTVVNPITNTQINTLDRIWDTLPDGTVIEYLAPGETLVQAPGDVETYYAQYVVTEADALKGVVVNRFEAQGLDDATPLRDPVYGLVFRNSQVLPFAELGDRVWNDMNRDGVQDAGELGIPDVPVSLYECVSNDFVASTDTDADGLYKFTGLMAGDYYVVFGMPAGNWAFSPQDQGGDDALDSDADPATGVTDCTNLVPGESDMTWDAGLYELVEDLDVSKTAVTSFTRTHLWDIDKTVTTDNGEMIDWQGEMIPKIWLYVDGSGDESAYWCVDVTYMDYVDSDFKVCGEVTVHNGGDLPATINSVADVVAGTVPADVDFGVTFPYVLGVGETITGDYCADVDGMVEGVNEVTVSTEVRDYSATADIAWGDPTTVVNETVNIWDDSDLFGVEFLGTVTAPANGQFCYDKPFAWADYDNPGPHIYENTAWIEETGQEASAILDVNWVEPAELGDFVWNDLNQDGIQDAGEPGIPGVVVNLYKCDDTPAGTTVTDANGYYLFDMLMAGDYYVEFVLPANYQFTMQDIGDDALDSDADPITGKTICTTLDAGETDLTWDAGMWQEEVVCWGDETAWAYGGDFAKPNWGYVSNLNWGWTNGPLPEGDYEWPLYAGAGQNILANGTIVGTVYVSYHGGTVDVTYETDADYYIGEAHLWVGKDPLPKVKQGKKMVYTNAPGQFPWGDKLGFDPMDSSTWQNTWTWSGTGFTGNIYVAAHAVVWMQVECPEEMVY